MAFNSSSSSNSSLYLDSLLCFNSISSFFIFITFSLTNILILLPLGILVLRVGLQRWQKQRSASTTSTTSHTDVFTYHTVFMEMAGVLGCFLYCCGAFGNVAWLTVVGVRLFSVTTSGQIFFDILSCVDRYLAVVHPIIYLGLRNRGGIRIRNVAIGCSWLLLLASTVLGTLVNSYSTVPSFCVSVVTILVVSFCSLSVLHTLRVPGPGEGGTDREKVHQSKIRAFHTIMAITGALLLRFWGHLLVLAIYSSPAMSEDVRCGILLAGVWFGLPSSLVLPLLFLHRAGKLLCRENNTESGH